MKKVLITGIDSFTGIHLSKYLVKSGYDVYGTSFLKNDNKKYKCDITIKEDIINVLNIIKPDFLIHLSAISFVSHGNNKDFYNVNTIGTINILDSFLELKQIPEKIILASSATIYGNQSLEILDESLCPSPANHYGASKYAMECLAKNYFDKLPIIITRPFNYTGIGQAEHFLVPKIVKHFKNKESVIELGNLDVKREFNDVSFICEAYKKLLESNVKNEIVNIASQNPVSLMDLIKEMNEISGYEIKVKVNPVFVRKDEIKILCGSSKKLYDLTGDIEIKELKYTLKEMYND